MQPFTDTWETYQWPHPQRMIYLFIYLFVSLCQLTIAPHLGVRPCKIFSHPCWNFGWLRLSGNCSHCEFECSGLVIPRGQHIHSILPALQLLSHPTPPPSTVLIELYWGRRGFGKDVKFGTYNPSLVLSLLTVMSLYTDCCPLHKEASPA